MTNDPPTTDLPHHDPAPTTPTNEHHTAQPDAPAVGDGQPPRKRRRSRGGRGRRRKLAQEGAAPGSAGGGDRQAGHPEGHAESSPGAHSTEPERPVPGRHGGEGHHTGDRAEEGAGGGRKRRRRRGRGGRDNANTPGEPARHGGDGEDDGASPEPRPARKPRQEVAVSSKDWEEIFEGKSFAELGLRNSILRGIEAAGFKHPTKIQSELIPLVLSGRDVLGQSRTGTGKTAAFGLPIYNLLERDIPFQALILAPTRELAIQISSELQELGRFTPIRVSAVYGGQNVGTQARQLDRGPEVIVATPGRLMDMVERGHVHLNNLRIAVLDEVDRMLDIGFRDDIRRILGSIKREHQTVFVSATISGEIEKLARSFMKNPEKLVTSGGSLTVSLVEQHYVAVQPWDKRRMLLHILTHEEPDLTVVFCRTKRTVDDLSKYLCGKGIDSHAIHGDMYQGKRNSVMKRLREGTLGVLVASDLAARGLDVDGISHVVNYDLPEDPEVYIHRIGRTARAGRRGVAWSLVTPEQGDLLTAIEMLANTHIPEKKYPEFVPGQLPADIAARRQQDERRTAKARSVNRAAPPPVPTAAARPAGAPGAGKAAPGPRPDPSKFPGGLVPTKLPPRMLGGRVKTARSMRNAPPQALDAAPAPSPGAENAPAEA